MYFIYFSGMRNIKSFCHLAAQSSDKKVYELSEDNDEVDDDELFLRMIDSERPLV